MTELDTLKTEYPGDDAWTAYSRAYDVDNGSLHDVASAVMGNQAAKWFETAIPALGNKSPQEVFDHVAQGEIIIRSVLMRFPQ